VLSEHLIPDGVVVAAPVDIERLGDVFKDRRQVVKADSCFAESFTGRNHPRIQPADRLALTYGFAMKILCL
jgi:hypothetical protein